VLTGVSVQSAYADGPARDQDSARYAKYECPIPADEAAMRAAATKLSAAVYDRNELGCSADIWYALAARQTGDTGLQVAALRDQSAYINEINTLWDLDYYGIRAPEWEARIEHTVAHGNAIAERLSKLAPEDPPAQAAISLYELAWTFKRADTATALAKSKESLLRLQFATTHDPGLFDGDALLALAKLYYELPEFSGGEPGKGVEAIAMAYKIAPTNPSVVRYYAFVQTQEDHKPLALAALATMASIKPNDADLQQVADELLIARDLAARLGEKSVQARLTAKRDALLAGHHELQTRAHTAANLHGGVDPVTGKDY
jgi:hypothetical protein